MYIGVIINKSICKGINQDIRVINQSIERVINQWVITQFLYRCECDQ